MAVSEYEAITAFEDWYVGYDPTGGRGGCLEWRSMSPVADRIWREYTDFKREMDGRVAGYDKLEKLADNEVISPKPDLPNVSSGETAGLILRIARNCVQNTPNVEVVSCYDDDSPYGIFSRHILTTKIIGSDLYSNDMQQNLFASTKTALALGFACVIPVLQRDPKNGWYMKYDTIHYRDVFPEPGVKDVRDAPIVYVRRYLTQGEVANLIKTNAPGWDVPALKLLIKDRPPNREVQSVAQQDKKHRTMPKGYEIITRYDNTGGNFLTFEGRTRMLLRIEKNKHPLKEHPVHFLVLEKDEHQPLGKSQVERLIGRQDFQDLMLNGAMKLWYRNINPSILGFGMDNATPNLSPGKYTRVSNPNARLETFEVNTQTLMQYGQISQQNLGSMINLIGAADQQMATQAGNGMSATPQGVEAQQAMVDITQNNYQKAIESFFSHYCSYALTLYFQELKATESTVLTAESRQKLLGAGIDTDLIKVDEQTGEETLDLDWKQLAKEYWVRCVPGSLVEMEDEKQLRILNQLFVPLSQAMPAIAAAGDPKAIGNAVKAMNYIIGKQIELSGAKSAKELGMLWRDGDVQQVNERDARIQALEDKLGGVESAADAELEQLTGLVLQQQDQINAITQNTELLLKKLGVYSEQSEDSSPTPEPVSAGGEGSGGSY